MVRKLREGGRLLNEGKDVTEIVGHLEVARAQAAAESANQRAASAERLLEQTRADLQSGRDRHGTSLSQLHEQLAELIARTATGDQERRVQEVSAFFRS